VIVKAPLPEYRIVDGENELATAYGIQAARYAVRTILEEGQTGQAAIYLGDEEIERAEYVPGSGVVTRFLQRAPGSLQ
jgi:hypothetical protein